LERVVAISRQDRLSPPIMHAFRTAFEKRDSKVTKDERQQGERVIASRRTTARAPISENELRDMVRTDLASLLNTTHLESAEDLSTVPHVRKSILNYGFPDLASRTVEENSINDIAKDVEAVLADFEPRLKRGSIRAKRDSSIPSEEMRANFVVSAELRTHPVNLRVEFVAEVELDSGKVKIDRL
jgi:type VI secretion system protein ImpF